MSCVRPAITSLMVVVVLVVGVANVHAESPTLLDLTRGSIVEAYSREYRLELAQVLKETLLEIYNSVPAMSPSEEQWLQSEYERIDRLDNSMEQMKQKMLLSQRPEVARENVRDSVGKQLSWFGIIEASVDTELAGWAGLAASLLVPVRYAEMADLVSKGHLSLPDNAIANSITQFDFAPGFYPTLIARGILNRIVVPNMSSSEVREVLRQVLTGEGTSR